MKDKADIIVICGPTASGKTALSVALAQALHGEVVSADSMQVYRGMDIGTAKPTWEERQGIPHHMLDVADPTENYSVARYVAEATPLVDDILARGKVPIVAGGTGLYIDHLVAGRQFAPFSPEDGLREELQKRVVEEGLDKLREELERIDPQAASRIHPNDEKRILRALEVFYTTGKTITQHNQESQQCPPKYHPLYLGLTFVQRPHLWERINQRVDEMMAMGLEEEVRGLLAAGIPMDCTAMQAIGYKEMVAAILEGRPVESGAEEVKLRSRQYAKRQLTWFRRNPHIHWYPWGDTPDFSDCLEVSTNLAHTHGLQ